LTDDGLILAMLMVQYSISRRYAELLEIQLKRPLTDREAAVFAILRDCVERYESEETAAVPAGGKAHANRP
jgi:hypothetical protein